MRPLPRVTVAPNGARLGKADHPELSVTHAEIVACAEACFQAGADRLHAHIRDENGGHLLNVAAYRDLLVNLRRAVPELALGAEAEMVSASIREMCRAGTEDAQAFYRDCAAHGIAIQHILYDDQDCSLLRETLPPDLFLSADL